MTVTMEAETTIGAHTILPAVRRDISLTTADAVTLVGELALPAGGSRPAGALICLHPLPTAGGSMDSHVLLKASFRLPALADLAVLRFNTRGTTSPRGSSGGRFGGGLTERHDVETAVAWARAQGLTNRWLLGWSFGTELALMHGTCLDVVGAILLSPPVRRAEARHLAAWQASGKRLVALIPEYDDFLPPDQARAVFDASAPDAELIDFPGAKHLWVGEKQVCSVLNQIVTTVCPGHPLLPTTTNLPTQTYHPHHHETVGPKGHHAQTETGVGGPIDHATRPETFDRDAWDHVTEPETGAQR